MNGLVGVLARRAELMVGVIGEYGGWTGDSARELASFGEVDQPVEDIATALVFFFSCLLEDDGLEGWLTWNLSLIGVCGCQAPTLDLP